MFSVAATGLFVQFPRSARAVSRGYARCPRVSLHEAMTSPTTQTCSRHFLVSSRDQATSALRRRVTAKAERKELKTTQKEINKWGKTGTASGNYNHSGIWIFKKIIKPLK